MRMGLPNCLSYLLKHGKQSAQTASYGLRCNVNHVASILIRRHIPSEIWLSLSASQSVYDVWITSNKRWCDVTTSSWRQYDVISTSFPCWNSFYSTFWFCFLLLLLILPRSGGGVVDNTLDYQSRGRKIDPPLLRSFGWDFKPRSRLRMTSLLVGR